MAAPVDLDGLPFERLSTWLDDIGVGARHAPRVFRAVHRDDRPLGETPDLGRHAATIARSSTQTDVRIVARHPAPDGSVRLVFGLSDGARIEGVLLPNAQGGRATLCLSSQVGCAMACTFCATGTMGLTRHLRTSEIVGQVRAARHLLAGSQIDLSRLVFMGMGEPLHNLEALRDALSILLDRHGRPFAQRNVTVSTIGQVARLRRFTAEIGGRIQLALSLHAGTDATRRELLPAARNHTMEELKQAVLAHPLIGRQHWMMEYVVLPGINDSPAELNALAQWMSGIQGVVNLIPFNPFPGAPYRPPTDDEVNAAWRQLKSLGVPNTVRWPRGRAAQGACGQLMLQPHPAVDCP